MYTRKWNKRTEPDKHPCCSFCGKFRDQVKKLIPGRNDAYICHKCVGMYAEMIAVEEDETDEASLEEDKAIRRVILNSFYLLEQAYFNDKWPEILEKVKEEYDISEATFQTFLKPLSIADIDDSLIYLRCPDSVGGVYYQKNFYLPIKVAVKEIMDESYEIEFICEDKEAVVDRDKEDNPLHFQYT